MANPYNFHSLHISYIQRSTAHCIDIESFLFLVVFPHPENYFFVFKKRFILTYIILKESKALFRFQISIKTWPLRVHVRVEMIYSYYNSPKQLHNY